MSCQKISLFTRTRLALVSQSIQESLSEEEFPSWIVRIYLILYRTCSNTNYFVSLVADPAGPGFYDVEKTKDSKKAAINVQIIHTSSDFGTTTSLGHQDWFMGEIISTVYFFPFLNQTKV